jgi:hypothetical protein
VAPLAADTETVREHRLTDAQFVPWIFIGTIAVTEQAIESHTSPSQHVMLKSRRKIPAIFLCIPGYWRLQNRGASSGQVGMSMRAGAYCVLNINFLVE